MQDMQPSGYTEKVSLVLTAHHSRSSLLKEFAVVNVCAEYPSGTLERRSTAT